VDCVGGIVLDGDGRLLLVLRGRAPSAGTWSVPGGRVEAGESDADATAREVLEETGMRVEVGRLAGEVERDGLGGDVYVIRDYLCRTRRTPPGSRPRRPVRLRVRPDWSRPSRSGACCDSCGAAGLPAASAPVGPVSAARPRTQGCGASFGVAGGLPHFRPMLT
jgi:hypothetical protein